VSGAMSILHRLGLQGDAIRLNKWPVVKRED
jgi:hypothetical protein